MEQKKNLGANVKSMEELPTLSQKTKGCNPTTEALKNETFLLKRRYFR